MKIIKAVPGVPFSIGRQGEHKARQVQFNIAPWHAVYGEGVVQLLFQRPGEEAPYPVAVDRQDTQVLWTVTSTDTEIKSRPSERIYGYAELRYYVNDALAKSEISTVSIYDALDTPGEIPDPPGQSWLDQTLDAAHRAEKAAERAENAAGGNSGGGSGEGFSYEIGTGLKVEDNTLMVDSAEDFNGDNDRPASAALVKAQLGNIEVFLATI